MTQIKPRQIDLPLPFDKAASAERLFVPAQPDKFPVFDFSDPTQVYALSQLICRRGQKTGNNFYWESRVPIVLKLSLQHSTFHRDNLQDVLRVGHIDFKGATAEGYKNGQFTQSCILPSLSQSTQNEFSKLRDKSEICELVVRNLSLRPAEEPSTFHFEFSQNDQDALEYQRIKFSRAYQNRNPFAERHV